MNKNTASTILIVDDETMICETLVDILTDEGYQTYTAGSAAQARTAKQMYHPDLILLDIWMPDSDGITLLREWTSQQLNASVIMMSGHGTIETAVEATKLGAYDFLEKPLSTAKLLITIKRALQTQALIAQNAALKAQLDPNIEIIGRSQAMNEVRELASNLAKQNVPVLISGNAGSGKQHVAHFIHQNSAFCDATFITANIAAMETHDITAALIGSKHHTGLLAAADGGTLFIDEISQLPKDGQRLLLGLIEEQAYLPANQHIRCTTHIRVIAATRLPPLLLKEHLDPALFDLLMVATIILPDLQDHSSDVPELLEYFSKYFADFEQMPYRHFSLAAQNTLRQHRWTGNVRELKNLVQRLLIQNDAAEISAEEAEQALTPTEISPQDGLWSQIIPKDLSLREARELFEHQYLLEQFRHCDGNIARLANRIGMERSNLYRKLRNLGIDPTDKP